MVRTTGDRLVLWLAQGCGLGWSPYAPGTVGSLGAIGLAGLLQWAIPCPWIYLAVVGVISVLGVMCCQRAIAMLGDKDPGSVVIDEIAAVLLIFTGVPWTWVTAIAGFALFRLLDITKPGPIGWAERAPGGWGIMADDLCAGGIVWAMLFAAGMFQVW